MTIAIMQPYLFPYIGYFQLLNAVDRFVVYDDVQFIKEGWIHRNRILSNGQSKTFTIPLFKASYTDLICDRTIAQDRWVIERGKLLTTITQNYGKAPYHKQAIELVESCLLNDSSQLTDFILNALRVCCSYIGIDTEIIVSSKQAIACQFRGQDRVISICKALGTDHYINAIGGTELYAPSSFEAQGIKLSFLKSQEVDYPQFKNTFVPWLSIIDIMMFNSRDRIQDYLGMYELV